MGKDESGMTRRQDGFYWVEFQGEWIVSEYKTGRWFIPGIRPFYDDKHMAGIDEKRIVRTEEDD